MHNLEYATKGHRAMHIIQYSFKLKVALFFSFLLF